jgi:predicted PilT family ATPase
MALGEKDDVPAAIKNLTSFIKKAKISGRTEIELEGDVGLSLVTPEKYRYEIIGKITEDAKKLRAAVGEKCRIEMSGLSNRVSWQRSDVSELTLYIPYQVQLSECE